jgi:hypothetical protein
VVYILEDKEIHMEAASIILWIIYLISHVLASADLKYDDYLCDDAISILLLLDSISFPMFQPSYLESM